MTDESTETETLPQVSEEFPITLAARIASRFDLPGPVEVFDFPEKGNINLDTYLVRVGVVGAAGDSDDLAREYILQRINHEVFNRPDRVMNAMIASIEAQERSLAAGQLVAGREWEAVRLVPTRSGNRFFESRNLMGDTCWRLMYRIAECRTYKSLSELEERSEQLRIAEEAGRGLATYSDFTADMDIRELETPLPGYRDTRVYFDQLLSVLIGHRRVEEAIDLLPSDPVVRASTEEHFRLHLSDEEYRRRKSDPELVPFIELAKAHEDHGMTLVNSLEDGRARRVGIHGDTKLENFLFSKTSGQCKALVDLDTIMPHTWLADWGDMLRSLANVAGEKETDLSQVNVDVDIYEAVARGFLETAKKVTSSEVDLMVVAVEVITLELGVRFLTDYLRGDNYFQLSPVDPPTLNKTRAQVQLTLFSKLRMMRGDLKQIVQRLTSH